MAWRSRKETGPTLDKIENVVGRSCIVRGDLIADGAFRVDGTIEGSVESKAAVVVSESATVTGNVRATDVVVAGKVHGNVQCSGHLEILATGLIQGDIEVTSLRIETGGVFAGVSLMGGKALGAKREPDSADVALQLSAVR
jgi:Integral membrane protein CcmA involved in cell shape determination